MINQVQEAPEGDEVVMLHDFPETRGAHNKVVPGPFPATLIPRLDHTLLHLKPQESFQLRDSDRLEILCVV